MKNGEIKTPVGMFLFLMASQVYLWIVLKQDPISTTGIFILSAVSLFYTLVLTATVRMKLMSVRLENTADDVESIEESLER